MVILFAVLTSIIDNREQSSLINEINRVLKHDGIIYINDFLLNTDTRNRDRYKTFKDKYGTYGVFELPEGAILRHHDPLHIQNLVKLFHTIKFDRITFKTMNGHLSNGFIFMGRKCGT